jgi:hypothetical protein
MFFIDQASKVVALPPLIKGPRSFIALATDRGRAQELADVQQRRQPGHSSGLGQHRQLPGHARAQGLPIKIKIRSPKKYNAILKSDY